MALNPSASGCRCKTLFYIYGDADSQKLRHQLLSLVMHINAHFCNLTSPSQIVLSDRDLRVVKELLKNSGNLVVHHYLIELNENVEAFKQSIKYKNSQLTREPILNLAMSLHVDTDIIKELLIHGADACEPDFLGMTPLHKALGYGNTPEIVKELLRYGADANADSYFGETPLHLALKRTDDSEIIEELIKYGSDVNKVDALQGRDTPLGLAVTYNRSVETVKALLRSGANSNTPNKAGKTPLTIAIFMYSFFRNFEVIGELLKLSTLALNPKTCNKLLNRGISDDEFSKTLIKYNLILSKGVYYKFLNLNMYEAHSNYAMLSRYLEDCIQEIVQMQTLKVRNGLSLLTFVTTKDINVALYPDNESLVSIIVEENLTVNYPIYGHIISPKVKYALERATLLNKLKDVLACTNWCASIEDVEKVKVLIDDCVYVITQYLSNKDLHNFILASCNSC